MPFVSRNQISPVLRKKAEVEQRERLREALRNPALTEEQRKRLKQALAEMSRPKKVDSFPEPGVIPHPGMDLSPQGEGGSR